MLMKVRKPAQAGRFYSGRPDLLANEIRHYLGRTEKSAQVAQPIGLISPHAGYRYSGLTAAHAYRQLQDAKIRRVIILAPSHHAFYEGATIFDGDVYETPLGQIPIDTELAERLCRRTGLIRFSDSVDIKEHAVEVQVPFLQVMLRDFLLLPIVVSKVEPDDCRTISACLIEELAELHDLEDTLFVASSDLYHGYSHEDCLDNNRTFVETITRLDADGFEAAVERHQLMACGASPLAIMLRMCQARGARYCDVLHQTSSQDVSPAISDYVVGYCSAVIY